MGRLLIMKKNKMRGFTLIELLLYSAIVSIIVTPITLIGLIVVGNSQKSAAQQEVFSAGKYLSELINFEIRNCNDINIASSNFGSNLALNAGQKLSLANTVPNNPTEFDVLNGKVRIKKGVAAAVELNSMDTKVTNLTFTNYTSADNKTKNVSYVLTIQSAYSGARQEYMATISAQSSAEVRSN
jgi:prepilin-type N-terminal cleavage/methylation domain-containing protein